MLATEENADAGLTLSAIPAFWYLLTKIDKFPTPAVWN
jgi:hypothetical protein